MTPSSNVRTVVKLTVGLGLIAFLLYRIEVPEALAAIMRCDPYLLALGFATFALSAVAEVWKLKLLLGPLADTRKTAEATYIGLFFNNFLPSNVGGDLYKIHLLGRESEYATVTTLVFLDRVIGLALLIGAAFFLALYFPPRSSSAADLLGLRNVPPVAFLTAGAASVLTIIVLSRKAHLLHKGLVFLARCRKAALDVSPSRYVGAIMVSALYHLLRNVALLCFVLATGESIAFAEMLIVLAVVAAASVLPVSFGGLGVREGAFVVGLGVYGVQAAPAFAVAILARIVLWLQALAGGAVFLFERSGTAIKARETSAAAQRESEE